VPEGEEEFCEVTEEEFRKFEADPDAVQHVIISTEREPDYSELLRNAIVYRDVNRASRDLEGSALHLFP